LREHGRDSRDVTMILAVLVLAFVAGDVRPHGHQAASMRRNLALRIIPERNLNWELLAIWRAACPPDAVLTRLEAEHLTSVAEGTGWPERSR